ncbi:MAG: MBL fold metallo-hydrolase [Desulfobacterales bacterium]|nr:MBL fold metallo-hydrolase [Desulfobacteraceae bacterium]MBT7085964.1 MBL fold metallo-hydrolase [Desulfobacterales bacterium]
MTIDKKYDRPIKVSEGIYWVGYRDEKSNLSCNPYLVVQGDKAVLIDSGSRTDFAAVMMKVLQAGVDPQQIVGLIYQHYDPDLCGSMSNFIDMCDNPEIKIISEENSNVFISFYIHSDKNHLIDSIDNYEYKFNLNGRILEFIKTPYSHSPGSFVTFDKRTKTLFTSDLFGSYSIIWDLFLELTEQCYTCLNFDECPNKHIVCPVKDILAFHKEMMPNKKALRYALSIIKKMNIECIAPQHGSILNREKDISFVIHKLETLEGVGIDGIL